jgi:hypothetical protein
MRGVWRSPEVFLPAYADGELVRTRDLPACATTAPWVTAGFSDIRLRLAGQVAAYEDVSVRRLRIRDLAAR